MDLSTQQALFRNTLEKLLCSSVSSDLKLAALLEHPGGREWQDDDLALDLKRRLQGSYDVYMASVNDMEALVQTLQESIGLNKQGIVGIDQLLSRQADLGHSSPSGSMLEVIRKRGKSSSCVSPGKSMREYCLGWIRTIET